MKTLAIIATYLFLSVGMAFGQSYPALGSYPNSDIYLVGDPLNYLGANVNSLNIAAEFAAQQGGATQSSATYGASSIPAAATTYQVNGVSGWTLNQSPNTNAVAGYFQARGNGASSRNWSLNTLCVLTAGLTSQQCTGIEADINVNNTSDLVAGINVTGYWNVVPSSANTVGIEVSPPHGPSGGKWQNGFVSTSGASINAFVVGASASSGSSLASQLMTFLNVDSGGNVRQSTLSVSAAGQFLWNPYGAQTVVTGSVTAAAFYPQTNAAGPFASYQNDFFDTAAVASTGVGSPTGQGCGLGLVTVDQNHPGDMAITTGTAGSGTGVVCSVGTGASIVTPNSSLGWTYETAVDLAVLPSTTSAVYYAGMNSGPSTPYTQGFSFFINPANSSPTHWYCNCGTTNTDTGIAAVASSWYRFTIVNDGALVHWYVNGTQVCGTGVAIASTPSNNQMLVWSAVAGTATSVAETVDYVLFQRNVVR